MWIIFFYVNILIFSVRLVSIDDFDVKLFIFVKGCMLFGIFLINVMWVFLLYVRNFFIFGLL